MSIPLNRKDKRSINVCANHCYGLTMILALSTSFGWAEPTQLEQDLSESVAMEVVEESPWEFGIGVGFGRRSNPLIGSNELKIPAFVNLSYFEEGFFFDNGDFGWTLGNDKLWTLNLIIGVNSERQYFSGLDRLGFAINASPQANDSDNFVVFDSNAIANNQQIAVNPPKRQRPWDGGLEWILDGDWGGVTVQALTDITDKHNGEELWINYSFPIQSNRWTLTPSAGFVFKSARWVKYFYGVGSDEIIINPNTGATIRPAYSAGSALNLQLRMKLNYRINTHWYWISILEREQLDNSIKNSPIVNDDNMTTYFTGFYYQF